MPERSYAEVEAGRVVPSDDRRRDASAAVVHSVGPSPDAAPLLGLFTSVLRHRRLIARLSLLAGLVAAAVSLWRPRQYVSTSAFVPQVKQQQQGLSSLAAQYGLSLGASDPQSSPAFYVDLLTSRAILGQLTARAFGGTTLADLYRVRATNPAVRDVEVVTKLRRHVGASLVQRSGIIRLQVSTPSAAASQELNRAILERINDFNLNTRRSQAKAERIFAEQRLVRVRAELRAAEDRLERFYRENRAYADAPGLQFTQQRLDRDVDLQRQINATLSQQAEQSRLDEVRDTPIITVLEQPDRPARPAPRGTVRNTVLALLGGAVLGVLIALLRDTTRRALSGEPQDGERALARYRTAAARDLRRPWALLGPDRDARDAGGYTTG